MQNTYGKYIRIILVAMCFSAPALAGNVPKICDSQEVKLQLNNAYERISNKHSESKEHIDVIYGKLTNTNYQNGDFKSFQKLLDDSFVKNVDSQLVAIREVNYDMKNKTRTCEAKFQTFINASLIEKYQNIIPDDAEFKNYTNKFKGLELGIYYIYIDVNDDM